MTTELRNQWYRALLSGDYEQGRSRLRDDDGRHSALGVLADVLAREHATGRWQRLDGLGWCWRFRPRPGEEHVEGYDTFTQSYTTELPASQWFSLTPSQTVRASAWNDKFRFDFATIAGYLEDYF